MDVVALLLQVINMVAKFKSNAMSGDMMNYLELMQIAPSGKITNLTQAMSSCYICNSELVRSLVVGGPIFNLLSIL